MHSHIVVRPLTIDNEPVPHVLRDSFGGVFFSRTGTANLLLFSKTRSTRWSALHALGRVSYLKTVHSELKEFSKSLARCMVIDGTGRAKHDEEARESRTFREETDILLPRLGRHEPCCRNLRWTHLQVCASPSVRLQAILRSCARLAAWSSVYVRRRTRFPLRVQLVCCFSIILSCFFG